VTAARSILLLGHPYDPGTRRLRSEIRSRSGCPVMIAPPELLAAAGWRHHVDTAGRARTQMRLPNGRWLSDEDVGCVVNRWDYLPTPRLRNPTPRDAEYGALEFQALIASWLAGLADRVVNPVGGHAIDVGPRSPRAWLALAGRAGLPIAPSALATAARWLPAGITASGPPRPLGPYTPADTASSGRVPVEVGWPGTDITAGARTEWTDAAAPEDEVLVAGRQAVDAPTVAIGDACVEVTARAGCAIAAFHFERVAGRRRLCRVNTRPKLTGPGHAAAVAELCLSVASVAGARR
jgi:hypothetical protein